MTTANEWRHHPKLKGRFHPQYPDDIQVVLHDGGPRLSTAPPEIAWVRVTGGEGDLFSATVLNQPTALSRVSVGDVIRFKVSVPGAFPVMVTDKYLLERADWIVHPCDRCGLAELLDAPSDLIRVIFPPRPGQDDEQIEMVTSFCGVCGGVQLVQRSGTDLLDAPPAERPERWWEFWR